MDHWRVAQVGGEGGSSVVVTAWYWSDLWRDCYEDSTAVVNCVDFGVLWTVKSDIQVVRGLLLIGLCLGLLGTVLTFFGMECTRLGGDQRSKDRMLITASVFHLLGCASDLSGYCLYINRVGEAFLHAKADPTKLSYEMGPPMYLGLVGPALIFLGCFVQFETAYRVLSQKSRHPMIISIAVNEEERDVLRRHKHVYVPSKIKHSSRSLSSYKMATVVTV